MIQGVCSGPSCQRYNAARTMPRYWKRVVRGWLDAVRDCNASTAPTALSGCLLDTFVLLHVDAGRSVRDGRWFHQPADASFGLLLESGWSIMAATRGCLLVACLLLVAGAQTSAAVTAADQAGPPQNTGSQGSLMGSTHIRQLKVGRCQHIRLVHVATHNCAQYLTNASCLQRRHVHHQSSCFRLTI